MRIILGIIFNIIFVLMVLIGAVLLGIEFINFNAMPLAVFLIIIGGISLFAFNIAYWIVYLEDGSRW